MLITLESSLVNRTCVRGLVVFMFTLRNTTSMQKKKSVNEFTSSLIRRKVLLRQLKTETNGTDVSDCLLPVRQYKGSQFLTVGNKQVQTT